MYRIHKNKKINYFKKQLYCKEPYTYIGASFKNLLLPVKKQILCSKLLSCTEYALHFK
jgi:hypothetical protein